MTKNTPNQITKNIYLYTDGSCLGNPGPGGWAFLCLNSQKKPKIAISGFAPTTTNNRMEMQALISGLNFLKEQLTNLTDYQILAFSDSNLLVSTINLNWKKKANVDLWLELDAAMKNINFQISWVKAHHKDLNNNLCDQLANLAAKSQKPEIKKF